MKKTELTFTEGFTTTKGNNDNPHKVFDWDVAAYIIKQKFLEHNDLFAEVGLQGDWDHTSGQIFENGKPTNNGYSYLSSNWAIPTLILSWDGQEQEEIECFLLEVDSRFSSGSKWDKESLKILGIQLED